MKVDLLLPSIVKDEPYAMDEGYLSYCYRFTTLMLSMSPLSGVEHNLDIEVEFDFFEGGLSNGTCTKIIIYMDRALW